LLRKWSSKPKRPPRPLHAVVFEETYRIAREALSREALYARDARARTKIGAKLYIRSTPGRRTVSKGGDSVSVVPTLTIMMGTKNTHIRVLVVDDHPLLREGVKAVLDNEPDIEVRAEASNGREAVDAFRAHHPDVVLMDIQMPEMNGIDAIRGIRLAFPAAKIIVLTTYKGDVSALRALRAGAVGYLLKGELRSELVNSIRLVHAGGRRVPAEVAAELAAHLGEQALTEREIEVLRFVADGNSNKQAGAQLGVAEETVKAHMKSICSKLSANDRTHAVTIAIRRGILDL